MQTNKHVSVFRIMNKCISFCIFLFTIILCTISYTAAYDIMQTTLKEELFFCRSKRRMKANQPTSQAGPVHLFVKQQEQLYHFFLFLPTNFRNRSNTNQKKPLEIILLTDSRMQIKKKKCVCVCVCKCMQSKWCHITLASAYMHLIKKTKSMSNWVFLLTHHHNLIYLLKTSFLQDEKFLNHLYHKLYTFKSFIDCRGGIFYASSHSSSTT